MDSDASAMEISVIIIKHFLISSQKCVEQYAIAVKSASAMLGLINRILQE